MKNVLVLLLIAITNFSFSQEKIPLDYEVYNDWISIGEVNISDDGEWLFYEINPYKGDGILFVENPGQNKKVSFSRGIDEKFSGLSDFIVFKVKPQTDTIVAKKLKKVKKKDLPKDSLFIYSFTGDTAKFANIKSYKIPKYNSDYVAFLHEKELKKKAASTDSIEGDTTDAKKAAKSKIKPLGTKFCIFFPATKDTFSFKDVTNYSVDNYSNKVTFIRQTKDSLDTCRVYVFDVKTKMSQMIFEKRGEAKNILLDEKGTQIAFLFSSDTSKKKPYSLYYTATEKPKPVIIADTVNGNLPNGFDISPDRKMVFSREKGNLFFGIRPKPVTEVKDTIIEEEKCHVDVWSWTDKRVMPQQLKELDKDLKESFLTVFYPKTNKIVQLEDSVFRKVNTYNFKDAKYAIARVDEPYLRMTSWDIPAYADYYLVNTMTGEKALIKKAFRSGISVSPDEKYLYWFDVMDSCWYSRLTEKGTITNLTRSINANFYNEDNDVPAIPGSYGLAGWTENDKYVLIYDRFDIWKIDPEGNENPENITKGRKENLEYRYIRLDNDKIFVENKMFLKIFNKINKKSGYAILDIKAKELPKQLVLEDFSYLNPVKSKNSEKILWSKTSTVEPPELRLSNIDLTETKQITNIKSQQKKYNWCTSELTYWVDFNGDTLSGIIYKPEDFNLDKKYPMVIYFYEQVTDRLNRYFAPAPSRSTINITFYASNGYVVFTPDIKYGTGHPGKDAYNSIVSGTLHMIENRWIDKEKIGIQGQSWGGYQVGYLVTQTNIFACAEAGAPVSNMTSAYGGIRWASGRSREFQYEKTQSRIGGTLWDKRSLYIENSPVFFADRVGTPLLIMHNDNDGAVPWYQGIEYFMALRRLNKPVWMLTYNGDSHNLTRNPNKIDLTIRMSQFFNHYLKNAPAPDWMKYGVPAVDKDKKNGYNLIGE